MSGIPEAAAGGPSRLPELDVYRGVALVLMVLIHNMFTWTPLALRQWPGPWQVGDLYFGMSASLFFAASGAASFVSLRRRMISTGSSEVLRHVGSRALLLYVIGIAFEQVWHGPPYDLTFFAELNTIAVIGLLAFLFVLRDFRVGSLTIVAAGMASSFFLFRYVFRLDSIAYGVYVITPIWTDVPPMQFVATFPLTKLAVEFGYAFLIWGSFGVVGVILARLMTQGKLHRWLFGLAAGLMVAGYVVQAAFFDPLQKWPMSISYFLLASGFTIIVLFLARGVSAAPGALASVSSPLTVAGRYTLPLYFAHYLVIFFSEATGLAATVRESSSDSVAVLVVGILAGLTLGLLATAWVADRFHVSLPVPRPPLTDPHRTIATMLVASAIVGYIIVAGSLAAPTVTDPTLALGFFVIGSSMSAAWYVAYRVLG